MTLILTTQKITASPCQFIQQDKVAYDTKENYWDQFGNSVSISGNSNTAIVGAPLAYTYTIEPEGMSTGSAYIFTKIGNDWQQTQLIPSDGGWDNFFGQSVSISSNGDTVIVGSPWVTNAGAGYVSTNRAGELEADVTNAGAGYVFIKTGSTWSEHQKLVTSDAESGDQVGISAAISSDGNTLILGAYGEDTGGFSAGAAYIFIKTGSTWSEQAKIQASDKQAYDEFGYSVSISGDGNTVIVGAHKEDEGGSNAGAAYVFTRSGVTWTQQQKIQASDKASLERFSISVSISGNTIFVGTPFKSPDSTSLAGLVYVFTKNDNVWTENTTLAPDDPLAYTQFGHSVSVSGNAGIIGRWGDIGVDNGAAYIFTCI